MKRELLIFLLMVTTIQACMPIVGSESTTSTQPVHTPTNDEKTVIPALPTQDPDKEGATMIQPTSSSNLENLIEKAKEDLARRLSISAKQIDLVEANEVVWPNASLGCPQPGMVYADVLTPGYLVLLEANGKEYEYHASRGTEVFYCENPIPPASGTPIDQ